MFSQVSLCPRGVSAFGPRDVRRHPPWADTPPRQTPPRQTPPPRLTPPAQCMPGYGQQPGSMHPTGMHSCYDLFLQGRGGGRLRPSLFPLSTFEFQGYFLIAEDRT